MKEKRLIVNADDFGMSQGITDAVLLAHRYGFLTSASLMVNMLASEYAVTHACRERQLSVGIHLNICAGKPLLPPAEVPTLVDSRGNFHAPSGMIRRLWRWQVAPDELEAEFRAQIRWMKQRGCTPTHADSHHHMHIYPAAALPFARALKVEGISCARVSRCAQYPHAGSIGGPHEGSLPRRILVQAYRAALDATVFHRFLSPDSRISFLPRDRRNLNLLGDCWKAALAHLPSGSFELACHPGFFERGFSEGDRIHLQREEELRWLTDREFRQVLDRNSIHLINYSELACGFGRQRTGENTAQPPVNRSPQPAPELRNMS
jgi:chitin disaccharide deacetylase